MTEELIVERRAAILRLEFNRPRTLNAFTPELLEQAVQAVEEAGADPEVRVIVLTGAGRAFSSGADLSLRARPGYQGGPAVLVGVNRLVRAVATAPKPVVAAVNGPAAGGACSVVLAADLSVVRESAYLVLAFAATGLMPDGGATVLVPRAVGRARAARMALLAERVYAPRAERWGLITQSVPDEDYASEVDHLLERLATGPTAAYARTKQAMNAPLIAELDEAFARESAGQRALTESEDFAEGLKAFGQKRKPEFKGR